MLANTRSFARYTCSCIRRIKTGKVAGCDSETDHLFYAGPILVLLLKVLFNVTPKLGCVLNVLPGHCYSIGINSLTKQCMVMAQTIVVLQ